MKKTGKCLVPLAGKAKVNHLKKRKGLKTVSNVGIAASKALALWDNPNLMDQPVSTCWLIKTERLPVRSTRKSSISRRGSGSMPQHSAVVVAPPSIQIEQKEFRPLDEQKETVTSLTAMLLGFLGEMFMSSDTVSLAMHAAKGLAMSNGVTEEGFDRVLQGVMAKRKELKSRNPVLNSNFME